MTSAYFARCRIDLTSTGQNSARYLVLIGIGIGIGFHLVEKLNRILKVTTHNKMP